MMMKDDMVVEAKEVELYIHTTHTSLNMIIAMQWKEVNDESAQKFFSDFLKNYEREM